MVLRVAVIGAGAAGLAALRHMRSRLNEFKPVAYEQMSVVGGTWVYTDDLVDRHGRPTQSSLYKHLKTNLPKEVMAFPDFPFSDHLPSFLGHEEVRKYLEDYTKHFDLHQFIQFETEVVEVCPQTGKDGATMWSVRVKDLTKDVDNTTESVFDAVMVCNGHYTVPLIPDIPGLKDFKGTVFHSHTYRTPEPCRGKRVIVLGARSSGVDLAIETAAVADKVWLCHRQAPLISPFPENVVQGPGIKSLSSDSATLDDGQIVEFDVLAFCTGYLYSFPFLSPECRCFVTEDQQIMPLYKHLVHIHYPTLSFIGITKAICPFPQFHCQIQFMLAVLSGKMQLPSADEMEEDAKRDFGWRLEQGFSKTAAHTMGDLQWDYNDELARMAGFEYVPPVVKKLYRYCHNLRSSNLIMYRQNNFRLCSEEEFLHLQ